MCDKNINELLDIDFSTISDEFNWVSNVSTPIETINGQLRLMPEDSTSFFRRGLGIIDPANNRIRLRINLDLLRPQTSLNTKMTVVFGVYIGSELIDQFTIFQENITSGERVTQNLERDYKYDGISGSVSLRISLSEGYSNQLFLDYLKAEDYFFCEDSVRTYFNIDEFLEKSFASVSSGIQLLEWKIDDVETLTPAFFAEIINTGGNPLTEWFFAKADIDGSNRIADVIEPNSFNPFESELGLLFDTVSSFHGGKPTGTLSGSNYGAGIMSLGFEKPSILNGNLDNKSGSFFVDIDYSKNLRIVFNSLVNNTNSNVFDSPYSFRKYFIIWDADNCKSSFYYQDQLASNPSIKIPMDHNGFLYGITGGISIQNFISCDESFSYSGNSGVFEFVINFGTDIGECGINYNAFNVPDKFEILWNEQTFSTGYVGSNQYDQQLLNAGVNQTEINTGNPSTGSGALKFIKATAEPSTAIVRITAILPSTGWDVSGICPQPIETGEFTQIIWDDTSTIENRSGNATEQLIFYTGNFYAVTDKFWQIFDGVNWIDNGAVVGLTKIFTLDRTINKLRMKALNGASEEVYSNVLQYTKVNTELQITSSVSLAGAGTIDIINGNAGETINLKFNLNYDSGSSFASIGFSNGIAVSIIDTLHTERYGTAVLDSNGEIHGSYLFDPTSGYPDTTITVQIIGRSGAGGLPTIDTTTII